MEKNTILQIKDGLETAFINKNHVSNLAYKPQMISNNYKEGKKVLCTLEEELLSCDEFSISVAFITLSGITPLLQTLKELEKRNIKGRILTTDYLMFSEPKALKKLAELENIQLKMYVTQESKEGFHTKGYIFKEREIYRILIGSSNMTMSALTKNKEWNTKIVSTSQGEYATEIIQEFEQIWDSKYSKEYEEYIDFYESNYNIVKQQKEIAKKEKIPSLNQYRLKPNKMQAIFSSRLKKLYEKNENKALLISATGTGKTYASAFAVRDISPKKLLFLVHREQIARQALKSYKKVFGNGISMGVLSGNEKNTQENFIFSTMQMMSKEYIYQQFKKDEFDVIVIDEVHKAGANSYQQIMNYFQPKLWLGMTASPERTDGFDIYGLFNHNIAYEIRLQQALEENLLCPFHYFGITDLYTSKDATSKDLREFNDLVADERVDYILEKANYYGYSGTRVKGLIFCSRKDEAMELSKKFNDKGLQTKVLTGDDSMEKRMEYIERLTSNEIEDKLDYIFTVDIFNEGVDIPEINQVIMLRPTQSPIIFVQQLGRGLRKSEEKEYVVILDFIGNYNNNFMIPMALFGDKSYNKDTIRKYVREGNRLLPGCTSIHFDEISRKRIYESIDTANFNDIRLIKESYQQLKFKLGRIPSLMDFEEYGSIDVLRIFDNKSLGSYYKYLKKYEKDYTISLTEKQEKIIEFISKKLASGKRVHELLVIKRLLHYKTGIMSYLENCLKETYNIEVTEKTKINVANVLTNEFTTGTGKETYSDCIFIEKDENDYKVDKNFAMMLEDRNFYHIVEELVEFGLYRNRKEYSNRYKNTSFQLYAKYTYEDVCRILEWEKGEVALNIGGYKYDKKTKTYPIFINYEKEEGIANTVKYEDRFETQSLLIAISKSGRTLQSEDVYTALKARELGIDMELFVRKNKDDKTSKEFYYLGKIYATGNAREFTMPGTTKTAVEIQYELETPVRDDVYDYITK